MAKEFGILKILFNWDSIPAIIITAVIGYYYIPDLVTTADNIGLVLVLIGSNAGLLGIVLAGFSIFIAFMDEKFLPILRESKLYEESIFMFTYSAMLLSIALILTILFPISVNVYEFGASVIFIFALFFTFYGLLSVVLLFIQVKNIAVAKGRYVAKESGKLTQEDF